MNALLMRGGGRGLPAAPPAPRVLLVTNDDALRLVLSRELHKRGFDAYSTGSGAEAVEMYCRSAVGVDLVLVDANLPRGTGPEAIAAILRADPLARSCFVGDDGRPGRFSGVLSRGAATVAGASLDSVAELCGALWRLASRQGRVPVEQLGGAASWKS